MPESHLKLADLVPVERLEELRRLFAEITGVPLVFTDADGQLLTEMEHPLRYCGALVSDKARGILCLRRRQWDVPEKDIEDAIRAKREAGHVLQHRCRGGFRDAAVPIDVEGRTLGYAVFARTLVQPPDMDYFRQLAVEGGMSPQVGEQVAREAIILTPDRLQAVGDFLRIITGLVASAALDDIRARRILDLEQMRDSLIHMMVHDLRTPLTSIVGGLQTLVDVDYDPELIRELVPIAVASANTLVDMVSTILDLNKMEHGGLPLDLEPTNLAAVVGLATSQVEGLARERGHTLRTDLNAACPALTADAEKLRRLFINLLGNAIKFTPNGGTITVATHCEPEGVRLSVSDTGPGIPADQLDRIFDKYAQVRGAHPQRNSTGLGLTFCKMVAEAHGGRIWAESELGHGSTFHVVLPVEPTTPTEPA
ncbi:MAG: PocR ligand-binding domain-containing protein [Armatimonadetes bacterium]|nr:PocR ligand-binding domain-containing protein [Armatimonadota bacterium]